MSAVDDRAIALVASRACEAAALFALASVALSVVALASLAFVEQAPRAAWTWWLVALPGAAGTWFAFRLTLDARVFADLASSAQDVHQAAVQFDAALASVLGRPSVPARAITERARGARRLIAKLVAVVAMQFAVALIAVLPI